MALGTGGSMALGTGGSMALGTLGRIWPYLAVLSRIRPWDPVLGLRDPVFRTSWYLWDPVFTGTSLVTVRNRP